jgi:hypothetical protein
MNSFQRLGLPFFSSSFMRRAVLITYQMLNANQKALKEIVEGLEKDQDFPVNPRTLH